MFVCFVGVCTFLAVFVAQAQCLDFGLYVAGRVSPLPLESVAYKATIIDSITKVEIHQVFANPEPNALEAEFKFPLDNKAAVVGFQAEVDGKVIKGVVEEKGQAEKDYKAAIRAGHGAYLAQQVGADLFSIRVGNLPPGKSVTIRLTYIAQLDYDGPDVRFILPMAVIQKYTPAVTRRRPSLLSPALDPVPLVSSQLSFPVTVHVDLRMSSAVTGVTSPSHQVQVGMTDPAHGKSRVSLASASVAMTKDFVLLVKVAAEQVGVATEIDSHGRMAAMVSLFPKFDTTQQLASEVVFIVDRSGSMDGSKIEQLRQALLIMLRSLPEGIKFNIVSFGSSHEAMFPAGSVAFGKETFKTAEDSITTTFWANLGGTEILEPLRQVLESKCLPQAGPAPATAAACRQVFVLTDGEVSNTDEVLALVGQFRAHNRVFAVGIGNGASRPLVQGIASAGGGTAEFIGDGERIGPQVMRQVRRALSPSLSDVTLTWKTGAQIPLEAVMQAPKLAAPLFSGDHFTSFALFPPRSLVPNSVVLKGTTPYGPFETTVEFDLAMAEQGEIIHRLAAKSLIAEMEAGAVIQGLGPLAERDVRSRIVKLGTTYQLATRFTSFVAVEYRDSLVQGKLTHVEVPMPMGETSAGAEVRNPGNPGQARVMEERARMMAERAQARAEQIRRQAERARSFDRKEAPERDYEMAAESKMAAKAAPAERKEAAFMEDDEEREEVSADDEEAEAARKAADESTGESFFLPASRAKAPVCEKLILLASFDGTFTSSAPFLALLAVTDRRLAAACPAHVSESDWVTAVALAMLEAKCKETADEWKMIASKAHASHPGLASIAEAAREFVAKI